MKLHYRFNSTNTEHSRVSLFINERLIGELCMSPAEATWLDHILARGIGAVGRDKTIQVEYSTSYSPLTPMGQQVANESLLDSEAKHSATVGGHRIIP